MALRRVLGTRTVLLLLLLGNMASFSVISLLSVGQRMRQQVRTDFSNELSRSLVVFENAEAERLQELAKEDQLLADLPSLKALLTTGDDRTIQDGAGEFWTMSGNDVFALTDPSFRVRASFVRGFSTNEVFRADVSRALFLEGQPYFVSQNHLFHLTAAPVYFGTPTTGALLGYVVTGDLIDTAYQTQLSKKAGANVAFAGDGVVLASSVALAQPPAVQASSKAAPAGMQAILVGGQRNLALRRYLSDPATGFLSVIFFKSLQGPDLEIRDISRLLLLIGAGILLIGSWTMTLVANRLTRPLEELARQVRSFDSDHHELRASPRGTREIRQLACDFAIMQERVELSNRARLESERLATIGSMANSVSHDLRHYLASIYANAEFLATPDITEAERAEFFQDIRTAVMETTDMLESLLVFSRTGQSATHIPERLEELAQRAIDHVCIHPGAASVAVSLILRTHSTTVAADGRQVERAFYNLLLNACQSAAASDSAPPAVTIEILCAEGGIAARITDNGSGIAASFSETIFDPFVSQGKQNGTGLGLTLCRHIAEEHGGRVRLLKSAPGETVFELYLPSLATDLALPSVSYDGDPS